MPSRNIYLTPDAAAALAARSTGDRDVSRAACRMLERYAEVARRCRPELSEAEWSLLRDACNGWAVEPASAVAWLPLQVDDAIRLDELDRKWGVDGPALIERLRRLDYAGCLAVLDEIERWWATGTD